MPAYDYRCEECGVYEHHQKITEKPLKSCIKCGGGKVQRLISASGIVFKGDGFHITDYRNKREHHHHTPVKETGKKDSGNKSGNKK
ncbi:hypothetical protein A3J90_00340 [candidate division WOR-1 bacterium RIFOXYC2_FULL_37_10]|uniref:Putative regulatory protein FmdB zinc ribbon domain-containing protein n=1 Tax=candidate division WOR-1 bacterium RIFOXYB2_FULL_37_13 TaxID=1802579 RepID=A0A1F4SMW1_UNCSA|nr:MAG: hypothetical protein A2246_02935 [candidate division WOR-1 bacterium RIFOXYA2_FULL_37_7]OGC21775.1 MAG: hypothetical protein A2310_00225 [candidate division WOR-1 bacterium RIFOXYB2_FULL_37_13]OGC32615.1 MAG: hypothetical protein A3J90_00340 [candidate division WOR-1 bacterium RIFOXYC2_FULL_37_10]